MQVKDKKNLMRVVKTVIDNYEIKTLNIRKPSLEDVFLKLTGKTIREDKSMNKRGKRGPLR